MRPLFLGALLVLVACSGSTPTKGDTDASGDTDATGDTDAVGDTDLVPASCDTCFVDGEWVIDNLSPCFVSEAPAGDGEPWTVQAAVSSLAGAVVSCPANPTVLPDAPWSTDTLTADCTGHYTLCVTLKAGAVDAPQAQDCVMARSCAEGDYRAAGVAQAWTDLEPWIATGDALPCAQQFYNEGGYAVLSVEGEADGCGHVSRTFGRVSYCPSSCAARPDLPECQTCASQDGSF